MKVFSVLTGTGTEYVVAESYKLTFSEYPNRTAVFLRGGVVVRTIEDVISVEEK